MPPPPSNARSKRTFRVLVTGYGPFRNVADNPSWLAVAPLHDTVVHTSSDSIHITAVGPLKVAYNTVLEIVPGFYARPPKLPPTGSECEVVSTTPPPSDAYDFIFHVGAGREGALSMEQVGHKRGYKFGDVDGNMAPVISCDTDAQTPPSSAAQQAEAARLGSSAVDQNSEKSVQRGFTSNYERFPENLHTEVDVGGLIEHLKKQGETRVIASTDAGYYLCDFLTYCGLAESQRSLYYPETGGKSSPRTKSLFMHVPPKDTPHSIEEMTEAVRQVLAWVCTGEKALP